MNVIIIESNLDTNVIDADKWNALTKEQQSDYFVRYKRTIELRYNFHITYADIAKEIGITRQAINLYTNRTHKVSFVAYLAMVTAIDHIGLKRQMAR